MTDEEKNDIAPEEPGDPADPEIEAEVHEGELPIADNVDEPTQHTGGEAP